MNIYCDVFHSIVCVFVRGWEGRERDTQMHTVADHAADRSSQNDRYAPEKPTTEWGEKDT